MNLTRRSSALPSRMLGLRRVIHYSICNIDSAANACTTDHRKASCQFCYGLNDDVLGVGHVVDDHRKVTWP